MTKATNPKDALGTGRLPMSLVPSSGIAAVTLAFLEGACKYGRFNWRASPVRASIYADAMHRHLAKWFNGEDCDEKTNVPHLASIIASAMILIDAELCGTLNDDRPPSAPMAPMVDAMVGNIAHIKEIFKEYSPHQFTIADDELAGVPERVRERVEEALKKLDDPEEAKKFVTKLFEPEVKPEPETWCAVGRWIQTLEGEWVKVITVEEYLKATDRTNPPFEKGFPYLTDKGGYGWGVAANFIQEQDNERNRSEGAGTDGAGGDGGDSEGEGGEDRGGVEGGNAGGGEVSPR